MPLARGSKNLFITTPNPSNLYIYNANVAWNFSKTLMTVKDTSTSILILKEKFKKHLLSKQALGAAWGGIHWIETNFCKLIPTKNVIKFGFQKYAAIKLHGNLKKCSIKQSIVYLFIY